MFHYKYAAGIPGCISEHKKMSWIDKYPMSVPKEELLKTRLMISADYEPQDTKWNNIKSVVIFQTRNSNLRYKVLVTEQDINKMVEAYQQQKPFTFTKDSEEDHAHVTIVNEKIPKPSKQEVLPV